MSEFRIFCVAAFIGSGLLAFAVNHGLASAAFKGRPDAILVMAFIFGCSAVALFGKRHT